MVSGTLCPAWSDQLKKWSESRAAAPKSQCPVGHRVEPLRISDNTKSEYFLLNDMENLQNRLPRGNMWSLIPVALLCMIVNWSERGRCPALTPLLQLITSSNTSGTNDHM